MAKPHNTRGSSSSSAPRSVEYSPQPPPRPSAALRVLGVLLLLVSIAASLMLVLEHVAGLSLPGCGPGSPCATLARSVWGKIPLGSNFGWPVSFLGLAYFCGVLAGWIRSRGAATATLAWIVRLGALASLFFIGIMLYERHFCYYCIAAHAANFLFWMIVERSAAKQTAAATCPAACPVVPAAVVFVLVSAALGVAEWRTISTNRARAEENMKKSTAEIIAKANQSASAPAPAPENDARITHPFTGRYRIGPEKAQVRLVIFSDFNCVDCNRIELELRALLEAHPGQISYSHKNYPFNKECNPGVPSLHDNACWAARAAEIAGILYGEPGFWKMHHWLFDHKGGFTNKELEDGINQLGFNKDQFLAAMNDHAQADALIKKDCDEATALGIYFTPMIFVNGVEVKDWVTVPAAMTRQVDAILANNPPAATAANDRPPLAARKYIEDWTSRPALQIPTDPHPLRLGPENAAVQVVLFGDYEEEFTALADRTLRKAMTGRKNVSYNFRAFPVDRHCNPNVSPKSEHPHACRAVQATLAAGKLAGPEAQWKMHDWLLSHWKEISDDAIRAAAPSLGLDATKLFAAMDTPEVNQIMQEDITAGWGMSLRELPTFYINGKVVLRWRREGSDDPILERILIEAGMK